ncbi:hypothetical protein PGB90_010645 [Kerria lacca]
MPRSKTILQILYAHYEQNPDGESENKLDNVIQESHEENKIKLEEIPQISKRQTSSSFQYTGCDGTKWQKVPTFQSKWRVLFNQTTYIPCPRNEAKSCQIVLDCWNLAIINNGITKIIKTYINQEIELKN